MKKYCKACYIWLLIAIVIGVVTFLSPLVHARYVSEEQTTYRIGDIIPYSAGCSSLAAMLDVANAGENGDAVFDEKVEAGECFVIIDPRYGGVTQIGLILKQFVYGPVRLHGPVTASVWHGIDIQDDEVWVMLLDHAGAHVPLQRV